MAVDYEFDVFHLPYLILAVLYALVLVWTVVQLLKLTFLATSLIGSAPNMKMRYELFGVGNGRLDCRGRCGMKAVFHCLLALSAAGASRLSAPSAALRARECAR